jgi:predicted ATP-grasp superfamily ATP-dependent carboligase
MISAPESPHVSFPPLVIIGASARAAAWSALRAGFQPLCCDQFADADLQAVAPVVLVESPPAAFVAAAATYPAAPLIYTGGLENHPEVLDQIAQTRAVWGVTGARLRDVRNPHTLAQLLVDQRLPGLETRDESAPPPQDGDWLLKPLHSSGGRDIAIWTPDAADGPALREPHYFQRYLQGRSYSAVFLAHAGVGDVRFIGLTEQLIGELELGGRPFAWCGNIGPAALGVEVENRLRRVANFLKWKIGLLGLFGLDFVVAPDEQTIGVTEVNPRYPASLEILEFATGLPLLGDHCDCFAPRPAPRPEVTWRPATGGVLAKGIVYSPVSGRWSLDLPIDPDPFRTWPRWADIPAAGARVMRGRPLLTVYAQGANAAECRERLLENAASVLKAC